MSLEDNSKQLNTDVKALHQHATIKTATGLPAERSEKCSSESSEQRAAIPLARHQARVGTSNSRLSPTDRAPRSYGFQPTDALIHETRLPRAAS